MNIFVCFLVIFLGMMLVMFRILLLREKELDNQITLAYMQSMQELYIALQKRIEVTRRYRHDLAKHIQTLEMFLENQENDSQEMKSYMENLAGCITDLNKSEYCADEIVNSVLLVAARQCEQKRIPLSIQVEDTFYEGISEIDKVSLLHNLFDNAIEANERIISSVNKGIKFEMSKNYNDIKIVMENHICPGEIIDFKTKKNDKDHHGIGRKIIENIIKKYHGEKDIQVDTKQNIFREKIIIEPVS